MNAKQKQQLNMLVRVNEFGKEHGARFPASGLAREQFAAVADAVAQLSANTVETMSEARGDGGVRSSVRDALTARLETISRTARTIAEDAPGLDNRFSLPAQLNDQALVTTGRLFVRDAEALKPQFVAHGLPATFVDDLQTLIASFEQTLHDREARRRRRTAARATLEDAFASGLAAARKLDTIVTNQLHDDAVTMTVWRQARRVSTRTSRTKGEMPPADEPATPTETPASAPQQPA